MWTSRRESCKTEDLRSPERTSLLMDNLNADTYYKVEVRAHNEIGYSVPSELVFKTATGKCSRGYFFVLVSCKNIKSSTGRVYTKQTTVTAKSESIYVFRSDRR